MLFKDAGRNDAPELVLADILLFVQYLPDTLRTRLQMTPNGVAGDYVNTFTAPLFACSLMERSPAFVEKHLPKNIAAMTNYRDYLIQRVREHNEKCEDPRAQVEEALFVETMMDAPGVSESDAIVEAVRSLWAKTDMSFDQKITPITALLQQGVDIIRR